MNKQMYLQLENLEIMKKTELEKANEVLRKNLKDPDYRQGWKANIAMAFYDEFNDWCEKRVGRNKAPDHINEISNNAAERFLQNFCF